jgi:ligand-binding sensor domain-containing protein
MAETRFVAARKATVMVASLRQIEVSVDAGERWQHVAPPESLTQISAIAVDDLGNLWVGGREGAFYSTDNGLNWKTLSSLYVTQVTGIFFDAAGQRILVTANNSTVAFAVHLPDFKVNFWDTGWDLRFVRPVGDHLVGATMYDGIVVQPVMVDSKIADGQ